MISDDQNQLAQDPSQTAQPLPSQAANEPTLEEVAAQIRAANTPAVSSPVTPISNPPILTTDEDIPSSQPPPAAPEPEIVMPVPEPITTPSVPAPEPPAEPPDAIEQLDTLPNPPAPASNLAEKIAKSLAESEVIGEHQIADVADALTPDTLQELAGGGQNTLSVPVSITNTDGTNLLIQVPTKAIFDFLAGRTDLVTVAK